MRLSELDPKWIHPNVFTFLCPHCKDWRLSCKNVAMPSKEQWALFEKAFGVPYRVVGTRPEMAWTISGTDFNTMTVTPSIDASAAGCWHGFITNGAIT